MGLAHRSIDMRTFVTVIFPTGTQALQGLHAFGELHDEGTITVYEREVLERTSDGAITTTLPRVKGRPLRRTGLGGLIGALAGMVGGPLGAVLGASIGVFSGAMDDAVRRAATEDYVERIADRLTPGAFAIVAEVHEKEPAAIDARMAELGGVVLRETRREHLAEQLEEDARHRREVLAADRLRVASEDAEGAEHHVEFDMEAARRALLVVTDDARDELQETAVELDDKLDKLAAQIAQASPEIRGELEQRMDEIRRDLGERALKLTHAIELAHDALHG